MPRFEIGDGVKTSDGEVTGTFMRERVSKDGRHFGVFSRDDTGTIMTLPMDELVPENAVVSMTFHTGDGPKVIYLE